jgi:hypothetical protein
MAADEPGRERGTGGARPQSRYTAVVGALFLGIIGIALLNNLGLIDFGLPGGLGGDGGVLGTEPTRGEPLAQFAVPDIRGDLDGDGNVAQDDCETAENPCPPDERRAPACEIELEGAIRVCDLLDRPLVISSWFTRGADCLPTGDAVDRASHKYRGEVNFLSLNTGDDRAEVERIVSERQWTLPVGWDRDGTVSTVLGIGACPTLIFVFPGGILQTVSIGELDDAEIEERVGKLLRESRERAPR